MGTLSCCNVRERMRGGWGEVLFDFIITALCLSRFNDGCVIGSSFVFICGGCCGGGVSLGRYSSYL